MRVPGNLESKIPLFQWVINIDSFNDNRGQSIKPPTFYTNFSNDNNIENLYIRLYPKDEEETEEGYIEIYLHRTNIKNHTIDTRFYFSFLNQLIKM